MIFKFKAELIKRERLSVEAETLDQAHSILRQLIAYPTPIDEGFKKAVTQFSDKNSEIVYPDELKFTDESEV